MGIYDSYIYRAYSYIDGDNLRTSPELNDTRAIYDSEHLRKQNDFSDVCPSA